MTLMIPVDDKTIAAAAIEDEEGFGNVLIAIDERLADDAERIRKWAEAVVVRDCIALVEIIDALHAAIHGDVK